jgi:hypothetical protein
MNVCRQSEWRFMGWAAHHHSPAVGRGGRLLIDVHAVTLQKREIGLRQALGPAAATFSSW